MATEITLDDEINLAGDNVIPAKLEKPKATRASADKWGPKVMELGFCILPSLIFRAQRRLGLNPNPACRAAPACRFLVGRRKKAFP